MLLVVGDKVPPLFPCGGLTGGVFPEPAVTGPTFEPPPPVPPPDPPDAALAEPLLLPPTPPPADVIVLKTEFDPEGPAVAQGPLGPPAPPAPTVIGYVCAAIGKAPALQLGLGKDVLKPPAPPPPPAS